MMDRVRTDLHPLITHFGRLRPGQITRLPHFSCHNKKTGPHSLSQQYRQRRLIVVVISVVKSQHDRPIRQLRPSGQTFRQLRHADRLIAAFAQINQLLFKIGFTHIQPAVA